MEGLESQFLQRIYTKKLEVPNEVIDHSMIFIEVRISQIEKNNNGVIS